MSLMSKLLMSAAVATVALSANTKEDTNKSTTDTPKTEVKTEAKSGVDKALLLKYIKNVIVKNPEVKIDGVTIVESKTHEKLPGWKVLLTTMDLNFKGKAIHAPETMFIKDGLITADLVSLETGESYRQTIKPSLPDSYYDDKHLVFGDKDAVHKVVIFSDPQCPFCQETVPAIFKAAKENPKKIAVYYYHLPLLRIHPVSDVLTRIMHVAQHEGKMEMLEKIYSLKINPRETNTTKILEAVKKHADYSISASKIDEKSVKDAIQADADAAAKMMVSGTPTIYLDGVWDKDRDGYKAFIK